MVDMIEVGTIKKITDDFAEVMIERKRATGGCCGTVYTEEVFLKAKNLAGAKINERVKVESNSDIVSFRDTVTMVSALAGLLVGTGFGVNVFMFIQSTTMRIVFTALTAIALAVLGALFARYKFNSHPVMTPRVVEICKVDG
jgi:hypothetical protein